MPKKTKLSKKPDNRTYLTDNSTQYLNRSSREYSIYTLSRAIVGIDGLKSSQRKAIFALSKVQGKIKTMSLGGKMIEMEIYVHGDSSANSTISMLASPVSNNYPLIEGRGSFGTMTNPEPAAPRYTYVKKSKSTELLVLNDLNIVPMQDNYDGSTKEPSYFLPIIPLSLLGSNGISVGYKSMILPRDLYDIINNTIKCIDGDNMDVMVPSYRSMGCNENVDSLSENKYIIYGKAEVIDASTVVVKGLPPSISLTKFVEKLIEMENNGDIKDFDDSSTDKVDIEIKLPRGKSANWTESDVLSYFGLSSRVSENLVVLDENGIVKVYDDANDVIRDFIKFRFKYYIKRYEKMKDDADTLLRYYLLNRECFDNDFITKVKNFSNKNEVLEFISALNVDICADDKFINQIASSPSYKWTVDSYESLNNDIEQLAKELDDINSMLNDTSKIWTVYRNELLNLKNTDFSKYNTLQDD